ncbi:MAG TPA: PfkB family carbohydrate kinase [Solirubrobacteraceae bacterium]|nr:PfkB family carbohydrate kinase [Solirubrobacteraceae bacterium]
MSRYDYVALGHVACDTLGEGDAQREQPGGTAFYSALQAARLGLRALILTQGVPAQIEQLLAPYSSEFDLHVIGAAATTTLATRGEGAGRSQSLRSWAGAIVNPPTIATEILHLAPIARETPTRRQADARFVGITPQGLVRDWSAGQIKAVQLDAALLPSRFDAAVISEHEQPYCAPLFAAAEACRGCVAVTAGARPANVHLGEGVVLSGAIPHPVAVSDDLGAGDVFAAALFVALAEDQDPRAAVSFGHAAAAVRIAGVGPNAIGTRGQLQALLT